MCSLLEYGLNVLGSTEMLHTDYSYPEIINQLMSDTQMVFHVLEKAISISKDEAYCQCLTERFNNVEALLRRSQKLSNNFDNKDTQDCEFLCAT